MMKFFKFSWWKSLFATTWRYRIRYIEYKCKWVIEIDDVGGGGWKALSYRSEASQMEPLFMEFDTYGAAQAYVVAKGINLAYIEERRKGLDVTEQRLHDMQVSEALLTGGVAQPAADLPDLTRSMAGVVHNLRHAERTLVR